MDKIAVFGSSDHARVIYEVLDNIGSNVIAYGTPAKVIRKREVGEKYL